MKIGIQHQPLNLNGTRNENAIKELAKRLDSIEQALKYRSYNRYRQHERSSQRPNNQKQEDAKPTKAMEKNTDVKSDDKQPLNK